MKTSRRQSPQVNAGSMADIAFLLLIFFLVTAMIPNDKGIQRKLPAPCPPNTICDETIKKRNVLEIKINSKNQLLVDNAIISIEELKAITKNFIDNDGDKSCNYCNGLNASEASENPKTAVISLINDKETSYTFYIKVQDEITKAYYELRNEYAKNILKKSSITLTKEELKQVKEAYPFILSEAEVKH